jgi:hypothetical protein
MVLLFCTFLIWFCARMAAGPPIDPTEVENEEKKFGKNDVSKNEVSIGSKLEWR